MTTLVLSPEYEPLQQVDWKGAVKLCLFGNIEVLVDSDRVVRSVSIEVRLPLIVRLLTYGGRRRRQTIRFSKDNVYTRDKGRCQYCSVKMTRKQATLDHVVPRAQGGKTNWTNVVLACTPCNQAKGDRTPEEAGMPLRTEPVKPKWLPQTVRLGIKRSEAPDSWGPYTPYVVFADDP